MNKIHTSSIVDKMWAVAYEFRGSIDADEFGDLIFAFIFLKELGSLDVKLNPVSLWENIRKDAKNKENSVLKNLQFSFDDIEKNAFNKPMTGIFSEANRVFEKLGDNYDDRNRQLCMILDKISNVLDVLTPDSSSLFHNLENKDVLGDVYEYLISQFSISSGKKAGEFYTPQKLSNILSRIVSLDSQDPETGKKDYLSSIFDFACGSGSLLLNVKKTLGVNNIGKIYGQEKNTTTYNLARMNMILHGVKDSEFEIFHGDTLVNDWDLLNETNPTQTQKFDAIVANPPFSLKWTPDDKLNDDVRFKNYGVAPKNAADLAFLLHGLHYLKDDGTMAIILPPGVLFRGGAEQKIRKKLLKDGNIDCIIGLPANLFYSTGIPVCILVLKKCKKSDDILFIDASEGYDKGTKQNQLNQSHIDKIIDTYQYRKEVNQYSKRISLTEIVENNYNLSLTRYVDRTEPEKVINLDDLALSIQETNREIQENLRELNVSLEQLGVKKNIL